MADRIVVAVISVGVREGVVSNKLQTVVETLVYLGFKGVVAAGSIVSVEVAQIERDLGEKWATLILRNQRGESGIFVMSGIRGIGHHEVGSRSYCDRVDVVVGSVTGEAVRSLASDVGDFHTDRVGELVLHRRVP